MQSCRLGLRDPHSGPPRLAREKTGRADDAPIDFSVDRVLDTTLLVRPNVHVQVLACP